MASIATTDSFTDALRDIIRRPLRFNAADQAYVDALDAAAPDLSPAQSTRLAALLSGSRR
jgi:hypothetical protein